MITLAELVSNGTLSADMAGVLWAAAERCTSFLTVALPRFAGKSTLSNAVLALRPDGAPLHDPDAADPSGGYIVIPEVSRAPVAGYIWGEPVRRVFAQAVESRCALQTSLHADGVEAGLRVLTEGNRVPDEHVSLFGLVLYIERFGTEGAGYWRRLAELYELDRIEDGRPVGRTLCQWHAEGDRFETLEPLGADAARLAATIV